VDNVHPLSSFLKMKERESATETILSSVFALEKGEKCPAKAGSTLGDQSLRQTLSGAIFKRA